MADKRHLKQAAAARALEFVRAGMCLGLGTGSTAEEFIRLLAEKVKQGLDIVGVPTSERSRALCLELGVPLTDLDNVPQPDIAIDGADELDRYLTLIKGGGGALLREKIIAYAAREMLVIADESKQVSRLGAFPLPVEVNPFGLAATKDAIAAKAAALGLRGALRLRLAADPGKTGTAPLPPFITDGGHYILDASFHNISAPSALAAALCQVAGVVEHGLFFHPNCRAIVAHNSGAVEIIEAEGK
ncbi:ribose-5-phosphate isomerase RpiA [Candidatus Tokpelaia sp.]|uniref:ribose-5-phosphate isomerase RpiA n=1 Tax=Candidatus Tokpelaia sp. TaxID=2233777 RepID=UPI001239995C|nr:ribose-5-phosphate isomerase RpiA [Candidatus Tokpelaia sp.]KAA6404695.1 ribose 5-phosphate isomerase A [Candidatus Tokpelaia sp.]